MNRFGGGGLRRKKGRVDRYGKPAAKKSRVFALEIIRLYKDLRTEKKKERSLTDHLLRSGTSVGANIREAT